MKTTNLFVIVFAIIFLFIFNTVLVSAIEPFGASNLTVVNSSRAQADAAQSVEAQAGNVTELNIQGFSTTQSWQGYYGNVSGTIQLADSSDNVMYNWTLASPQGEIYASTNDSITWANIQCLNFTATGTQADDTAQKGATSLYGTNISQLESMFGIASDDVDGVDETFAINTTSASHDLFYTNSLEFSAGECTSTFIYGDTGAGVDNEFEEVLLYEPTTTSIIFASLLDEDVLGFDNSSHDFEMLVLEDGHETDTQTTTYFFYVELE